ncbi:MAG TPA: TIGR02147 family protein [Fibrobacteria bacterium]|nr:TIGR02147 family protein [Fibrobacteria bacterium]HOX51186.1 TIGR02147 family protein [Fibrobacteria bacterium]
MPDIFQHTDYRTFLREWFEESKKTQSFLSYRYLGQKVGVDPGYLVKVFQGARHLSEDSIPAIQKVVGMDSRQAAYFYELVLFTKARGERAIRERFQKLMALRDLQIHDLAREQYRFWLSWKHTAVRLLLALEDFRDDWARLAERLTPAVSVQDVRESVLLLEELGMIRKREEDGVWELKDDFISTGDKWKDLAAREFQRQALQLGLESLERHKKEDRAISTLSLTIPHAELPALKEISRQFRSQVMRWASAQVDPDSVYQLNLQIFPLALPGEHS